MDNLDDATKLVDSFDIDKALTEVSVSNFLNYEETIKYIKKSVALFAMLRISLAQHPLGALMSKKSNATQGYSYGWSDGYNLALKILKEAKKYAWDPAFTLSNLTNLVKNYELKYKDAVAKNSSGSMKSYHYKYYYRSALCAIIDSFEKFTGYKSIDQSDKG